MTKNQMLLSSQRTSYLKKESREETRQRQTLSFSAALFETGAVFGHAQVKQKTLFHRFWFSHSKISNSFLGTRQEISFLNPDSTIQSTYQTLFLLSSVARKGGSIVLIESGRDGELFSFSESLREKSLPSSLSLSGSRWIGGTLTNWESLSQNISQYAHLSLSFGPFLKKTRLSSPRYEKMKSAYPGFIHHQGEALFLKFKKKPDLLFIVDPNKNQSVLQEASRLHIPVIAFVDSNTDTRLIPYPIPLNTETLFWTQYCFSLFYKIGQTLERVTFDSFEKRKTKGE